MTEQPTTTWEQIGKRGFAISPNLRHGGWEVWRHRCPGEPFHGSLRQSVIVVADIPDSGYNALVALISEAVEITGITADGWVRNPHGDYVSKQVAKARPLRKPS